jgi:hypothetical protein
MGFEARANDLPVIRRTDDRGCLEYRGIVAAQAAYIAPWLRRRSFVTVLMTPRGSLGRRTRQQVSMQHEGSRKHLQKQHQRERFQCYFHPSQMGCAHRLKVAARTRIFGQRFLLGSRNLKPQVLGQPLANFGGKAIMHAARSDPSDVHHGHRCWSGHRDYQPEQRRERKSSQCNQFQQQCVPRTKVPDHAEGKQKHGRRNRSQHNERYVDNSMDFLPAAAVLAVREVMLVVLAHLRREAGNVVTPASQNLANEGINTLAHTKWLQPDGLQRFRLRSQHHSIAKQRLAGTQHL